MEPAPIFLSAVSLSRMQHHRDVSEEVVHELRRRSDLQQTELPYNSQVAALGRALSEIHVVRVGTVDKFQGQEAPVVIYSYASSSPEDATTRHGVPV